MAGATVTIRGISINTGYTDIVGRGIGINCVGLATIILDGDNTIIASSHAIKAYDNMESRLTIRGDGSLNARSLTDITIHTGLAGLTIAGGTIEATTEGEDCPAIGDKDNCGGITITSEVTRVTANKSGNAKLSIGFGNKDGHCAGRITIGGTVYYADGEFQNGGGTYLAQSPLVYEPQH